jgi:hypothetical protein
MRSRDLHGLIIEVEIDLTRHDEAEQLLHQTVVPSLKASPGFVGGYWLGSDDGRFTSIIVFDSEEAAWAVLGSGPAIPANAPLRVTRYEVQRVLADG